MSLFSSTFSFAATSSRPEHLYPLASSTCDSISPTSSRAGSPSSPTTTAPSSVDSSTDDLFALTNHLSASSLYPASRTFSSALNSPCCGSGYGRRSPPRSTPFTLPPNCTQSSSQPPADLLARRERRQAYVQDQLSTQSRRKLSLLVARMLGEEVPGVSRKHLSDGLHPSNVRVVPVLPGSARGSRRNTLAEMRRDGTSDEETSGEDVEMDGNDDVVQSIENGEVFAIGRERESANRISKRRNGGEKVRKSMARVKK